MTQNTLQGGWLTVNRGCNMRCSHCYQQDTEFDPKRNMSRETLERLIDIFVQSRAKNVVLIGGEPTIYANLEFAITRLVEGGVRPILITNGRALAKTDYLEKLYRSGLRNLTISIKAPDEDGYRKVTGTKRSFELVRKAITNCLAFPSLSTGISITMENYFVANMEKYVEFLLSLNIPHLNFDMGSPVLMADRIDVSQIPNPFVLARATEYVHEKLKETSQSYSFYITIPLCILKSHVKEELVRNKRISTSCHVSKGTAAVFKEDGSVAPCNHFTGVSFGKLDEDFSDSAEFVNFWSKKDLVNFREDFNSYPHENCFICPDWNICGGGCKIKWMYYDPSKFIGQKGGDNYEKAYPVFPLKLQR